MAGNIHDIVLSHFTLSPSTVFTEVSTIGPEDSPIPLLKRVLYSVSCHGMSWVKKTEYDSWQGTVVATVKVSSRENPEPSKVLRNLE